MIVVDLLLVIVFSLLLIKATDILLINLKSFSNKVRIGVFATSGFLVALATSLPELFVGLAAALQGEPNLSLGNVIGANIANLSLVIGGAALIGGTVTVRGVFLKQDVFYAFLAGAAPMLLLIDRVLSRTDGLILLGLYIFYQTIIFHQEEEETAKAEDGVVNRLFRRIRQRQTQKEVSWIFFGVILLIVSAEILVYLASRVALGLNLPILLVGMVWIAIGTTLPELIFEAEAIRKHQPAMVFGNLLGSIVANGTLILGLVAIISPIRIQAFGQYLLATMAFVVVFGLFYLFIRTKHRLDRWEGAVLAVIWLVFVLVEFLK